MSNAIQLLIQRRLFDRKTLGGRLLFESVVEPKECPWLAEVSLGHSSGEPVGILEANPGEPKGALILTTEALIFVDTIGEFVAYEEIEKVVLPKKEALDDSVEILADGECHRYSMTNGANFVFAGLIANLRGFKERQA